MAEMVLSLSIKRELTVFLYCKPLTTFLDENAVSFAQAEKLYYETSLINVGNEVQTRQDEPGECADLCLLLICSIKVTSVFKLGWLTGHVLNFAQDAGPLLPSSPLGGQSHITKFKGDIVGGWTAKFDHQ